MARNQEIITSSMILRHLEKFIVMKKEKFIVMKKYKNRKKLIKCIF